MSLILSRAERDRIQMDGYRAYLAGERPTDNPYSNSTELGTFSGAVWAAGYAASRTDRARANRSSQQDEPAE